MTEVLGRNPHVKIEMTLENVTSAVLT